jgi:hypothetical protein
MAVGKTVRFEVFKRDKFTCQYCGKSAPDVILHADHIHPKSKGGADDITNLVTSCFDCNMGKSDKQLDDDTTVQKQKKQIDKLQEKREQLEMMMEWHSGLMDIDNEIIEAACNFFSDLFDKQVFISSAGSIKKVKSAIKKYGLSEVLFAMRTSFEQYAELDNPLSDKAEYTLESAGKTFNYIFRILSNKSKFADNPELKKIYYIRGILNHRLNYVNQYEAISIMRNAINNGVSIDIIEEISKSVTSWTQFKSAVDDVTPEEDGKNAY